MLTIASKLAAVCLLLLALAFNAAADELYWSEYGETCSRSNLRHGTITDENTVTLNDYVSAIDTVSNPAIDSAARTIYWIESIGNVTKIRRGSLTKFEVVDILKNSTGMRIQDFALDLTNERIYWVESQSVSPCNGNSNPCSRIRRALLDGSNATTLKQLDPGTTTNLASIALDVPGGKIYWSDRQFTPFISRMNLDGSNSEELLTSSLGGVEYLEVDTLEDKLYWTEAGIFIPGDSLIRVGNLDASSPQDIVTLTNSTPRPFGLALDPVCRNLYWAIGGFCPNGTASIFRRSLDGNVTTEFPRTSVISTLTVNAGFDEDLDGTPDCKDSCVSDPAKTQTGSCGCGRADTVGSTGTPVCLTNSELKTLVDELVERIRVTLRRSSDLDTDTTARIERIRNAVSTTTTGITPTSSSINLVRLGKDAAKAVRIVLRRRASFARDKTAAIRALTTLKGGIGS